MHTQLCELYLQELSQVLIVKIREPPPSHTPTPPAFLPHTSVLPEDRWENTPESSILHKSVLKREIILSEHKLLRFYQSLTDLREEKYLSLAFHVGEGKYPIPVNSLHPLPP